MRITETRKKEHPGHQTEGLQTNGSRSSYFYLKFRLVEVYLAIE